MGTPLARGGRTVTFFSKTFVLLTAILLCRVAIAQGQPTQSRPVTDSSAQASPIAPTPKAPVDDTSQQASPIAPERHGGGPALPAHTAIHITLDQGVDSGNLKNGQTIHAHVTAAVSTHGHAVMSAGARAELSVIGAVPAGKINAVGEMSLQLMRVAGADVYTDTLTFRGHPGQKDLPDSAPVLGSNAGLASGASLIFHVLPPPAAAQGAPKTSGIAPGSVNGISSGSPGKPQTPGKTQTNDASNQPASGTANIPSGTTPARVTPANNTPTPATHGATTPH
jgi:hypothetical protein